MYFVTFLCNLFSIEIKITSFTKSKVTVFSQIFMAKSIDQKIARIVC